jgi:hypothetical protein
MPTAGRRFRVMPDVANVVEANIELAFESPQLVHALDFEVKVIVG